MPKKTDESIKIIKEFLYNLNLEDDFFTSLRADYKDFDLWFKTKQKQGKQAYITKNQNGEITSFLMLKEENENEDYTSFEKPFKPGKRMKVSTFKVLDTGKKIGDCFIKIIQKQAINTNVKEIYLTTYKKQESLIFLLKQNDFKLYTYKNTKKSDNTVEKEEVYVKII